MRTNIIKNRHGEHSVAIQFYNIYLLQLIKSIGSDWNYCIKLFYNWMATRTLAMTVFRCLSLIIAVQIPFFAHAEDSEILSFKKGEKIEIYSNTVEYYSEKKLAKFIGNVEAISDTSRISGDEMIVTFKKDGASDDKQSIDKIDILGNVHILKENDEAFGDKGEYLVDEDVVKITGNVRLRQEKNWMYGDELTYKKSMGEALMKSHSTRTKAIIWPKEDKK